MATINVDTPLVTVEMIKEAIQDIASPEHSVVIWHVNLPGFHIVIRKEVSPYSIEGDDVEAVAIVPVVEFFIETWNSGAAYNERDARMIAMVADANQLEEDGDTPLSGVIRQAADELAMSIHEANRRRTWITNINWGETAPEIKTTIERHRTKNVE